MKTSTILTTLCLLAAPCFAQEAASTPAATVAAVATTTDYDALTSEQKAIVDAHVALCDQTTDNVKAILLGIKDKATADAAAPQLQAAFDALDASWDKLPEELMPAVIEKLRPQKAKALEVDALIKGLVQQETPFFSSIALASALGEVQVQDVNIAAPGQDPEGAEPVQTEEAAAPEEEAKADTAEEAAPEPESKTQPIPAEAQAVVDEYVGLLAQMQANIEEGYNIILSVTDKATADAAAPRLKACIKQMNDFGRKNGAKIQELVGRMEAMGMDLEEFVTTRFAEALEKADEMQRLVAVLHTQNPPFYGSEALAAAFEQDPVTDEQIQEASKIMDANLALMERMKKLMENVTDTASAEAAVAEVLEIRAAIDANWAAMKVWLDSQDNIDAIGDKILDLYEEKLLISQDVDIMIANLLSQDPPCFGCEALHKALLMNEAE